MIFVTGGAGFIGTNFVRLWLSRCDEPVINLDLLTYAGNKSNLADLDPALHQLVEVDICDSAAIDALFKKFKPRAVVHFAAESHVDRSIVGPAEFIRTNVSGTFTLLQAAVAYWRDLELAKRSAFRFLHVSTDEVYGSLAAGDPAFTETTAYAPNSPYSASKAASDHLVRAYFHTYGLPTVTTNCSNNYGPYQFPEKLIPLMIVNALKGKALPIYGDGQNVRDWLYVEDHCNAIERVLESGRPGETYNIGGNNEMANLDVVRAICTSLDELEPCSTGSYASQIEFVKDRPGHDRRYAVDATKIKNELGWIPKETFETGLAKTVAWYLSHRPWCDDVTSGAYRHWVDQHYHGAKAQGSSQ